MKWQITPVSWASLEPGLLWQLRQSLSVYANTGIDPAF